jgi:hypothetical protein
MKPAPRSAEIRTADFEALVSDVAAAIWNQLIEKPSFNQLRPSDFPDIFEAVGRSLRNYQQPRQGRSGG